MTIKTICIEGVDGAGKKTQAKLLASHLKAPYIEVPNYNSLSGHKIKKELRKENPDRALLNTLFRENRLEIQETLFPTEGFVVLDRWTLSNAVYSAAADIFYDEEAASYHMAAVTRKEMILGVVGPDLTLVLKNFDNKKVLKEREESDTYEKDEALQKRAALYYNLAIRDKWAVGVDVREEGLLLPIEEVQRRIRRIVDAHFNY